MSIPLVQNNEKDSINTSIIAIKRNIERINMLLGLSNSEEIDTSKFATKDELQQAVTDLQPVNEVAVDNMHSVTSKAVAESLSYSTTEQKTGGYWIDGKPIYSKTFYSATGWTNGVLVGTIADFDKLISTSCVSCDQYNNWENNYSSPTNEVFSVYINKTQGVIYTIVNNIVMIEGYITIEYTKTTD